MAKKQAESCSYRAEIRLLQAGVPERVYFLYGPEDYLSTEYLRVLRKICLPDGDDGFSFKKFDGPELDLSELERATDAMPFLSARTFVELHNVDTNKISDSDRFEKILQNVPEYCTVAFYEDAVFSPDGRLKTNKYLKTKCKALYFDSPTDAELIAWIKKRFSAAGKTIGGEECRRLMQLSGTKINRLIPEIDKIAAFAAGDTVALQDIDMTANRIPEADVFELISCIASGKKDSALRLIADLLSEKKNEPIAILALLSYQLRRLYGVSLVLKNGGGKKEVGELLKTNWDKMINDTISQAKTFSLKRLAKHIEKCTDTDYLMKSSSLDDEDLLKSFVLTLLLQ